MLRQVGQLGALVGFLRLCRFVIGGKGLGQLGQVVDLLRQVGQLGALCIFLSLCRFIIGGEGCSLLAQAVDLPHQFCQLGALGGLVFGQCKCSQSGFQGGQAVLSGEGIQLS